MTPEPNDSYFKLKPRDAMIVARKVAKKDGYVDWVTLRKWTHDYQQAYSEVFGEQVAIGFDRD